MRILVCALVLGGMKHIIICAECRLSSFAFRHCLNVRARQRIVVAAVAAASAANNVYWPREAAGDIIGHRCAALSSIARDHPPRRRVRTAKICPMNLV
jgi:hypothetical protein